MYSSMNCDRLFWAEALIGLMLIFGLVSGCSPFAVEEASVLGSAEAEIGEIAFVGADGNIYLISAEGGDPEPVTSDARHNDEILRRYQNPTWDPSSGSLAYIELLDRTGGLDEARIHVLPAGADESEIVFRDSDNFPIYLDWSGRNSQLAILTSRQGISELRLWVADGPSMAVEIDWGQPYYWDWDADGRTLFAHVGGSATANPAQARISSLASIDSVPQNLELAPASFRAPAYRPQQGGLLVALQEQAGSQLVLLNDEGGEEATLAELSQSAAFSWSPDGDTVALVESSGLDPHSLGELVLLEMDGTEVKNRIQTGLDSVAAFFWSPDGAKLAAFVPEIVEPRQDQLISYSAQGASFALRLVLVEAGTGEWQDIAELEPTNDWLGVVAYHDQYQRSGTIWSPASDSIVYTSKRSGGESGVFVIEAKPGAEARLIAQGTVAFWSLSPMPQINQAE